ncbi:MAG: protein phosphatase 2C domain-containing protein [Prevotellaceae bacterium]|jgi:serine/threonine protein phosphatase PrpC|nr:protein phosphatase 2C domain-containing protein [Prevotellaceae bacterium]
MNEMNNRKVFAVSVQGANHIKTGKVCQDYSLAVNGTHDYYETCIGDQSTWERKKQPLFKTKPLGSIAVVADGHGGDDFFRSDKGSRFAAESARNCIADFLREKRKKGLLPSKEEINQLIKSIIKTWNEKVKADFDGRPFGNSEMCDLSEQSKQRYLSGAEDFRHAYGTTLIAAAICEKYWVGIHIGDGRFTILDNNGVFSQPAPWDDRCFLNVTTSICDDDASDMARKVLSSLDPKADNAKNNDPTVSFVNMDIPAGIFLCSDGIDDSYPVHDNEKYLARFYRTLSMNFIEKDFDVVYNDIRQTLPQLSKKGSGDDMSIAGIFDLGSLGKLYPLFMEQIENEKHEIEKEQAESHEEAVREKVIEIIKEKQIKSDGFLG